MTLYPGTLSFADNQSDPWSKRQLYYWSTTTWLTYEDDSFGPATNFSRPAPGREGSLRKACRRRTKSATASADQTGSKLVDPAFRMAVGRGASPLSIAIERARVSGKSRKAATTSVRIAIGHSPGRYLEGFRENRYCILFIDPPLRRT